jgi:Spy/CpxP family protein refolding chaperone
MLFGFGDHAWGSGGRDTMQNMTRGVLYTLAAVIVFFCAEHSQAENFKEQLHQMSPEERAELQTRAMQEELDLNAQQRTDVYAINLKYAKQAQPLIEQSGRKQRKKQQTRKLRRQKNAQLKTVLTPEQYERYVRKKHDI